MDFDREQIGSLEEDSGRNGEGMNARGDTQVPADPLLTAPSVNAVAWSFPRGQAVALSVGGPPELNLESEKQHEVAPR